MNPATFFTKYGNDVGPDDDYFVQFWSIKYGDVLDPYKAQTVVEVIYDQRVAELLVKILNENTPLFRREQLKIILDA